jgi:hypothetical protein
MGIADGTDLETTERYTGCGQVTRKVRIEAKGGRMQAIRHGQEACSKPLETEVVGNHGHDDR